MKRLLYIFSLISVISCTSVQKDYSEFDRVPLQSEITGIQPMTGIVLWHTNDKCVTEPDKLQLEFAYLLYSDVCKEKGVYDWSSLDSLLNAVAARGHQLVIRYRYTYVGQPCAVPEYIKAWPGYEEPIGKSEGRDTGFPDWRCE